MKIRKMVIVPVKEDVTKEGRNEVEKNRFHNYSCKENGNTAHEMCESGIYCQACKGQQV